MIDGNGLISLLGRSSVDEVLDRWLIDHDLLKRPKGQDLTQYLEFSELGLVLVFSAKPIYEEQIGPPVSDGRFIFSGAHFYAAGQNGKKSLSFPGVLPFGARFGMSDNELGAYFGKAIVNDRDKKSVINTFKMDQRIVVTSECDIANAVGLLWIKVEMIERSHIERGDV